MLPGSESREGRYNTILTNDSAVNGTTPFSIFAPDNIILCPALTPQVQPQSISDYVQILAACIRDRILELEGVQHTACTEATEDNTLGRSGDLESLVNSYSQVTKPALALSGIICPDIHHPTFNLPSETKVRKLQNIQRDFTLLSAFSQRLLMPPERNRTCVGCGNLTLADHYDAPSASLATCSLANGLPAISSQHNFHSFSLFTGCHTSPGQETLLTNLPDSGLTDESINSKGKTPMRSMPAKNSEDLRDFEGSNKMGTGQGDELDICDITFQPLGPYQGSITFPLGSHPTGELTTSGTSSNSVTQMSSWKYCIGEAPDLPHFEDQSAPAIESTSDYHKSRSSATHHGSTDTNSHHPLPGNALTRGHSRGGHSQVQSSLRRYLCPIPSCSRNSTNSKRVLMRSDNLGDHLRKVHKLSIPARTRIGSWVLTNLSLLRDVDKRMQVLHGGSLQ